MKTKQFLIWDGDAEITIKINKEKRKKVIKALLTWMEKYNAYSGEMIAQDDNCQIYSSVLIADIVDDILKPELEWKDE